MGHVDVQTTMNYLHHAPRGDEAALVAGGVWDPRHATAPRRAATLKWPEDCLFVQSSDLRHARHTLACLATAADAQSAAGDIGCGGRLGGGNSEGRVRRPR